MTNAERAAYDRLLPDSVDALIAEALALLPDGVDGTALHTALSSFAEQVLSRATSQAASATLHVNAANEARMAALEARVTALEQRGGDGADGSARG